MATVLLVDDQANVRRAMCLLLHADGHVVHDAADAAGALALLERRNVDLVLSDVRLDGGADGSSLLRSIRARDEDVAVVLMTAFGTIDAAVEAMKAGAYDYLSKPVEPERLRLTLQRAAERVALSREVKQLRAHMADEQDIVAVSARMKAVLATVAQVARSDSPILITGESGTGKELLARAVHRQSDRRRGRWVPINCGAVTESLLESELFGHRKGAFTGAMIDKKGLLEEADGGVLFLDEIGEMPAGMQVRLLRFLQGGEMRRIGETTMRRADVRLVSATHRNLEQEVALGRFREDLYYRINVVEVRIPPLRERVEDIPALAAFILARTAARMRSEVRGFSQGALALMTAYSWPGNVRELQNAIERALNLATGPDILESDLPTSITIGAAAPALQAPTNLLEPAEDERARIVSALERMRWNQSRTAESLGISRTTLWRKLREFRIDA
jgi:DNA-binding NtrC family response regulator